MKSLIIKSISGEYTCLLENGDKKVCKPLGIMRHNKVTPKVGDHVVIENDMIVDVEERINDFERPCVSNVTKAIVVTSVKEPELNLNLLDRLLAIIEYNDIEIVLIFTKMDLVKKEELDNLNNIFNYYRKIGYKVYTLPGDDEEYILDEIKNNICVLAGQSGVGKSTMLNVVADLNIKTNEISKALGRGKHTTRHTELIKVGEGWVADTPGFGVVDFNMDEISLAQNFREFFETKCKFNGCLHENEPGCGVKEKVTNGEILKSRYDNYLFFLKELRNEHPDYRNINLARQQKNTEKNNRTGRKSKVKSFKRG